MLEAFLMKSRSPIVSMAAFAQNPITADPPGLAAWGTTLHGLLVTDGAPAPIFGVTETAFTPR